MAEAELKEHFATGNKDIEPDVLAELQSIMRLHELSAEDLFYKWESYCIKLDLEAADLSLETVRNMKQSIQDELEKSTRNQTHARSEKRPGATPRTGARGGGGGDVFGMLDGLMPNTPGTGKLNKTGSSKKRPYETPSISRVKADPPSSSPDYKSPLRMEEQLSSMQSCVCHPFSEEFPSSAATY